MLSALCAMHYSEMTLKTLKKKIVSWFGPWLAYWAVKTLGLTLRLEFVNPEFLRSFLDKGHTVICAFWHGRLLMIPFAYKYKGVMKFSFLVSPHRDGQVVGKALQRFGLQPILGSTTRKGFTAFKNMVRAQQDGSSIALVPDGPRGPRYRVQMGVIELARLTGRPVIPLTFSSSRKKIFNTWDRFLLPYPFSKGVFIYGEPVFVDPNGDRNHLEEKRTFLEKELNELTERADHYFD